MNSLNSYISIFDFRIKSKKYVMLFLSFIIVIFSLSFILNRLNLNITNNDIIKKYQLHKIDSTQFQYINTIIVGDSSGGNSLNDNFFNDLSGLNSENLCLTGNWGIIGSLGIIKKSLSHNNKIKNVIIIHTLDIWHRDFPKEALLELYDLKTTVQNLEIHSVFGYLLNPREIWWHIKYLKKKIIDNKKIWQIDVKHDYILQQERKFSNEKKMIKGGNLNHIKISESKKKELRLLDTFCNENSLNCIFLNGPIHAKLIKNSGVFLKHLHNNIKPQFNYIKYYPNIFAYPNYKIGDSQDHMDIKYKNEATKNYYNLIKDDLVK